MQSRRVQTTYRRRHQHGVSAGGSCGARAFGSPREHAAAARDWPRAPCPKCRARLRRCGARARRMREAAAHAGTRSCSSGVRGGERASGAQKRFATSASMRRTKSVSRPSPMALRSFVLLAALASMCLAATRRPPPPCTDEARIIAASLLLLTRRRAGAHRRVHVRAAAGLGQVRRGVHGRRVPQELRPLRRPRPRPLFRPEARAPCQLRAHGETGDTVVASVAACRRW